MAIQSTGVGSGLDVNSIITQLMAIERRPLSRMQKDAGTAQAQLSSYGGLKSRVTALGDVAEKLTAAATWLNTKATSSSDALSVTSTGSAKPVNLQIEVSQLARSQSTSSPALSSSGAIVGTGSLTIELGSWTNNFASFTAKVPASSLTLAIGGGEQTLAGIRDKINASAAGVTASILNDGQGSRLVLRSTATGAENGFRITVADDDATPLDGSGLSQLAFDPPAGAPSAGNQRALDLAATVNGAPVASDSNKLADLVEGVTVQLNKTTTGPVDVTVGRDTGAIKGLIQQFVAAYNETNKFLADQTRYDPGAQAGATLQGDRIAVSLQGKLRSLVAASSSASSAFGSLSSAGLHLQRDGSLKIDDTKLDTALKNLPELAKLFNADGGGNAAATGIARRFDILADADAGTGGSLESREESLRLRLSNNQDQQDRFNDRMVLVEARLRAQYTALDTKMAQLNGLSAYVTQQVQLLNNSNLNNYRR